MKYYLHNSSKLVNAIGTQTFGRLIRELEKDGYQAAEILKKMRTGALNEKPYQCTEAETHAIRIARGATPWIRNVLTSEWLGDGVSNRLTLSRWPFRPPQRRKAVVKGCVTCPHCAHEFAP